MKYLSIALTLVILTSTYGFSQTDSTSRKAPEFIVSGGLVVPYLPYPTATFWRIGYDFSWGVGYSVNPGGWGYATIYGVMTFAQFPFDRNGLVSNRGISPSTEVDGHPTNVLTGMAVLKGTFASDKRAIGPYFVLGVGFMNATSGAIMYNGRTVRTVETHTGMAYELGGGVDIPVSDHLRAFAEGKYVMGFTSDPGRQYVPVDAGVRINP